MGSDDDEEARRRPMIIKRAYVSFMNTAPNFFHVVMFAGNIIGITGVPRILASICGGTRIQNVRNSNVAGVLSYGNLHCK